MDTDNTVIDTLNAIQGNDSATSFRDYEVHRGGRHVTVRVHSRGARVDGHSRYYAQAFWSDLNPSEHDAGPSGGYENGDDADSPEAAVKALKWEITFN